MIECWRREGIGYKALIALTTLLWNACVTPPDTVEWLRELRERQGQYPGIVNDTLRILISSRCCGDGGYNTNPALHLVNTRTKSILWQDSVDGFIFNVYPSQLDDSTIAWFGQNHESTILIWKIGNAPNRYPLQVTGALSASEVSIMHRVRPWSDGKLILLPNQGRNQGRYALIDTAAGSLEFRNFSGDQSWLVDCDDISWSNQEAACLKNPSDTLICGIDLWIEGLISDSLRRTKRCSRDHYGKWWGDRVIDVLGGASQSPPHDMSAETATWADMAFATVQRSRLNMADSALLTGWYFLDRNGNWFNYSGEDLVW